MIEYTSSHSLHLCWGICLRCLNPAPRSIIHRAASWAAIMSVTASIAFLLVTLGMTFGGIYSASVLAGASMPPRIASQLGPLSFLFCFGVLLLLASFGLGGWVRSRRLGVATTIVAGLGAIAAYVILAPYIR
jgi:hypothetical protein